MLRLINLDNDTIIAEQVRVADKFWSRMKGLMFTEGLPSGCGLHLRPCRGIHTFFMRCSIDVLHLDSHHQVVGIEKNLQPGQIGKFFPKTAEIVELSTGIIQKTATKAGHRLSFQMQTKI
ncbi:MAG: DUF192 domain-containing protein [Alkaliphilus sp.]|nr:DUF192 domain-containing protein [Alkaliphilus sp.]